MAWSGFGQRAGPAPEAGQCVRIIGPGSGRMQQAHYQFPTFRLGCVLPQVARNVLCKTCPDPIWFWLTVSGFSLNGSGPEASRCARLIGPVSGQRFRAGPDRMRIGSGMFTGDPVHSTVRALVSYASQCECSCRTLHSASARFVHSTVRACARSRALQKQEDPQWGTVDAEFKVPSVVNPELTNVLLF